MASYDVESNICSPIARHAIVIDTRFEASLLECIGIL